jgi:hypothetical protein
MLRVRSVVVVIRDMLKAILTFHVLNDQSSGEESRLLSELEPDNNELSL